MATEPVANRRGSDDSLDEWGGEVWTVGDVEAGARGYQLLLDKEAPKAEPEDMRLEPPESEAQVTPHGTLEDSTNKVEMVSPQMCQEVDPNPNGPHENEACLRLERTPHAPDKPSAVVGETFPPPSPCNDLPLPAEGAASPAVENGNCISGVEVNSDPKEDVTSSDSRGTQEWPPSPYLDDPGTEVEEASVTLKEGCVKNSKTTGKIAVQAQRIPEGQDARKLEERLAEAAEISTRTVHQPPSRDSSDDVFTIKSPDLPVASEGEKGNQAVDCQPLDIASARRQFIRLDSTSSKPPQPYPSRGSSRSLRAEIMAQPAVASECQQGEQVPRSRSPLEHDNQEAAQQVFSQGSLPPETVATEPAYQGEAGSQGYGCVVMTERGEEERREGAGGGQTVEQGGEKVSGVDEGKAEEQKEREQRVGNRDRAETERQKEQSSDVGLNAEDHKASRMETDSCDDSQSDSGLSADFSPSNTMELHDAPDTPDPPANETPIEREIRRAVQREQSLRRSRGLQSPNTPQFVDIPLRKSFLSQALPSKLEKSQTKDRQFAGKKMQKEIHVEAQREQVLVQLGKIPGFYDKGTVRQLKERKQLFEAFQEPKDLSSTLASLSKAPSWASASDLSTLELPEDDSSNASTIEGSSLERRRSLELLSQTRSPVPVAARDGGFSYTHLQGPGFSEGTGGQVIILDSPLELSVPVLHVTKPLRNSESSGSLTETDTLAVADYVALCASPTDQEENGMKSNDERNAEEEEEEEETPKENPFFKLRSSMALDKVEQDIREARERERELRRQRSSLYGGVAAGAGGGGAGGGEGRRGAQSPTPAPTLNGQDTLDRPVTPLRIPFGTPTVRQSLGKLGMWPPPQSSEQEQVNIPESPQTPRQRTPLLQRWELGLVNGHGEGEED